MLHKEEEKFDLKRIVLRDFNIKLIKKTRGEREKEKEKEKEKERKRKKKKERKREREKEKERRGKVRFEENSPERFQYKIN